MFQKRNLHNLRSIRNTCEEDLNAVTNSLFELTNSNMQLRTENASLNAEIKSLNSQLTSLSNERDSLADQLNSIHYDISGFTNEIDRLNAQVATLNLLPMGCDVRFDLKKSEFLLELGNVDGVNSENAVYSNFKKNGITAGCTIDPQNKKITIHGSYNMSKILTLSVSFNIKLVIEQNTLYLVFLNVRSLRDLKRGTELSYNASNINAATKDIIDFLRTFIIQ